MHVNKRYFTLYTIGAWCPNVISWKHSFNRLSEEYEIAKKKQQALDGLYEKGRISQSTHDSYNNEIATTIAEIEKQQQDLVSKMAMKTAELENQIKTLEMLLTNYEIQHVTGEIDDSTYTQEINLFNNGLETAKHELQTIQDAMNQLCNPTPTATVIPEPAPAVETAPAPIPEVAEIPPAATPAEVTPSYVVSAPESIIAPVAEAAPAPVVEMPAPEPIIETPAPIAEAPIAAPEPIPAVVETPAAIEQPAPVVEAPTVEAPVAEAPVVSAPVEEASVVDAPVVEQPVVEAAPVEAPTVETPATETPTVETITIEAPKTDAPIVEAPVLEVPVETPAVVEAAPAAVEAVAVIEEPKPEKAALDEFTVTEPDVVQKELMQAVEEIAENPLSQAPPEAHEEAAKAIEANAETQPITIQAAKEILPEASSSNENKE